MMNLMLSILDGTYAVCRLEKDSQIPEWALMGDIYSITCTHLEKAVHALATAGHRVNRQVFTP